MPIRLSDMEFREPMYTWVADDGTNYQIASSRLRRWVLANAASLEIVLVPVDRELAKSFIDLNAVSIFRVHSMTREELKEPIIFCQRPTWTDGRPDVFLADGHHRYCRAAMDQRPHIKARLIKLEDWDQFRIVDTIEITKEQLKRMPVVPFQHKKNF